MTENSESRLSSPAHFKGKDALSHVAEAQADGLYSAAEIHGTEAPGHITAGADSARETAIALLFLWFILHQLNIPPQKVGYSLAIFSFGWVVWKTGRSIWLAWSRLERLHRIVAQEKYEIDHHRKQEREELKELYASKGFEGRLLEEVLDVLMADDERLLRVMVEEELGLTLATDVHPLKQGLGAFLGTLGALVGCAIGYYINPSIGLFFGSMAVLGIGSGILAYHSQNKIISAIVWNIGIGLLAFSIVYFLFMYPFISG